MSAQDPRCDFRELRTAPTVVLVWGTGSRNTLNRVLFGLALAATPEPFWVEIRGRTPEPGERGPADLGWIAGDRLFHLGDLLDPTPTAGPPSAEFAVISFLRDPSPEAITRAMSASPRAAAPRSDPSSGGDRKVMAIANVDRVDALWPESPKAVLTVVRAFQTARITPFFSTLKPTKRRFGADLVFQIVTTATGDWQSGALTCEKAPEGSFWKSGDSLPLTQLPTVSSALSGKYKPAAR